MKPRKIRRGLALGLAIALWAVVELTYPDTVEASEPSGSASTTVAVITAGPAR